MSDKNIIFFFPLSSFFCNPTCPRRRWQPFLFCALPRFFRPFLEILTTAKCLLPLLQLRFPTWLLPSPQPSCLLQLLQHSPATQASAPVMWWCLRHLTTSTLFGRLLIRKPCCCREPTLLQMQSITTGFAGRRLLSRGTQRTAQGLLLTTTPPATGAPSGGMLADSA